MFVFGLGMERCGTHSLVNIINSAAKTPFHSIHEDSPNLCKEAKLIYEQKDFRTPDLRKKLLKLRAIHKHNRLVCEANHRFSFFSSLLMKEFGPDCKFIFLYRNPVQTLISRISTWAHYPEFLHLYPEFFLEKIKTIPEAKKQFNEFRLSPDPAVIEVFGDLYLWEWIETYKYVRQELHTIPIQNRLLISCDDLSLQFRKILDFIGKDYFNITEQVFGWAKVKSDSIYEQKKELSTDSFTTHNRDPLKDETIIFAQKEIARIRNKIVTTIRNLFDTLPQLDEGIIEMERKIMNSFVVTIL